MSDPVSVSRVLPNGTQIGTLNSNLNDISNNLNGKVLSINNITANNNGKVIIDTGVLTINGTAPVDGNYTLTNPADIGVHPTQIIYENDEETHGVRFDNSILYFKDASGNLYEVETEPVEYAGHVVVTADYPSMAKDKIVTLTQGTEVRTSTFNSSGVATVDTVGYGTYTLAVSALNISRSITVVANTTTNINLHIPRATITITPVGESLYGKTVTLSDSQTSTFGSSGEAAVFTVFSTGIYSATCNGYSSGSIAVNALDNSYSATIYSTATLTFTLEGAKEDTITIKNADNTTISTVVFDTGATSKSVTLTGIPYSDLGNANRQYKFSSAVAKDTTTGTTDYSKNITLTNNLSEVKVMPTEGGDIKYLFNWYGNFPHGYEVVNPSNGWSSDYVRTWNSNIQYISGGIYLPLVGTTYEDVNAIAINSAINMLNISKIVAFSKYTGQYPLILTGAPSKTITINGVDVVFATELASATVSKFDTDVSSISSTIYIRILSSGTRSGYLYAMWLE